jgi:hypothetical protein
MQQNKSLSCIVISGLLVAACIEPYDPGMRGEAGNKFVVMGEVTDQEGYQFVHVSMASPIGNPEFIPLGGCDIEIYDDKGNTYKLEEFSEGAYRVWIKKEMLLPGTSFQLNLFTPSGVNVVSDFDRMPECADIDSLYFERKDLPTSDPDKDIKGIQFYLDLNGHSTDSKYYRWNMEETWEYHAQYPFEYYFDGEFRRQDPPDYSKNICWSTQAVKSFATLSTTTVSGNRYTRFPLFYVDNSTTKLLIGYSVLVRQYAISEASYNFWEQLRINSEELGGLYERQPLPVDGNLTNINHPDQKVIGFFGTASVKSRRIFMEGRLDLEISYDSLCAPQRIDRGFRTEYPPSLYPVNLAVVDGILMVIEPQCVDCTLLGGTLTKPEFWPK